MMAQYTGYVSGIFITASFVPYIWAVFKKQARPERASWLIWAVLGGISFFSLLAKGASHSLWLPGAQWIGDLVVFLLAIKYGIGGLLKRDIIALCAAAVGLLLWYLTREAAIALFFAIFIDGAGAVLTMIKSYELPATEPMSAWILTALGGLFGIFAVGKIDWILLSFPIYIFVINLGIILSIQLGHYKHAGR